jgi:pimeloyl-ACP methyl ester carboxylesterase
MMRRTFLSAAMAAPLAMSAKPLQIIDLTWYTSNRKFRKLPMSRVAWVESGRGPAALFLHGFPLNGYQWRGALERLGSLRRCIAPDVMSCGWTETPETQTITPETQAILLAQFLDSLHIDQVDLVGNDSGGLVSQLFVAKYPKRVRTLLLTNCDVAENNPPQSFIPLANAAKNGTLYDRFIVSHLQDKSVARAPQGLGGAFTYSDKLTDETIEAYFRPFTSSPLRKEQFHQYAIGLGQNDLLAVQDRLRAFTSPVRIVWGDSDPIFAKEWSEKLSATFPNSRGVKHVEGAKLFFPEEMPDLIAIEARQLWT